MEYETKMDIIELSRGYLGVIIISILFATGIVSGMYPGETKVYPNDMGIDNLVYTIIGNTTPVFPSVIINSTNITVTFPGDMTPNNFSIIFLEKETETIVQTIHTGGGGGGGSSRTITKYKENKTLYPVYIDQEVIKIEEVPFETIVEVETGFEWWHVLLAFVLAVIISAIIIKYYWKEE